MIAYGLDLAGYSSGKSGFARAERSANSFTITLLDGHPFARKLRGTQRLEDTIPAERAALDNQRVMVDIPVDLATLPAPTEARYIWQLTTRPVDYAFGAMPPLADRIGSPVARFQYIWRGIAHDQIFETYPALMLALMGLPARGYKGTPIRFDGDQWRGGTQLAHIANAIRLDAEQGFSLNDDEFDAVLCAIAGLASDAESLFGAALDAEVTRRIHHKLGEDDGQIYRAPANFRILKRLPDATAIRLERDLYSI